MLICPKCGKEMADGTKFCMKCGTKLEAPAVPEGMVICPSCGKQLKAGVKFCTGCGKAVETAEKAAAPAASQSQDAPKAQEPVKAQEPAQAEAPKAQEPVKAQEPATAEEPKAQEPVKADEPAKAEAPKAQEPVKAQEPAQAEAPKAQEPAKTEEPKAQEPVKAQEPAKTEEPKAQEPVKADEPAKTEEPKAQEPVKADEPAKAEASKAQEPVKADEPAKAEASKAQEPDKAKASESGIFSQVFSSKPLRYSCIALAVLLVLFVLLGLMVSGGKSKHTIMYLKGGEIYLSHLKEKDAWQVTSKLVRDSGYDNYALMRTSTIYECKLSEDGKILFFPDKIERGDSGATLYYRYTNNQKKDPEKLDSSVYEYEITKDGNLVTYLKTTDDLYQYSIRKGEKEKISSEVREFHVSEDGSKVVYLKNEGDLYSWNAKGSEKLDSDVDILWYATKNFKTVYYEKDDTLYRKNGKDDREKIASDVDSVLRIYESGEIYYTKADGRFDVLWYYNGKESEKITDQFIDYRNVADEASVVAYQAADKDDESVRNFYVAVKNNVYELEQDDAGNFSMDAEGKFVYYIADLNSGKTEGDLYRINISGGKAQKAEHYDSDVSTAYTEVTESDQLVYFKDVSRYKGDLYCDKKKIDSDVHVYNWFYCEEAKSIVYLADYDSNKDYGTLKTANAKTGKSKKIADDISAFEAFPDGEILYLNDYSNTRYKGELWYYKGGKSVMLDDDVTTIVYMK